MAFEVFDSLLVGFGDVGQAGHSSACLGEDAEDFVELAVYLAATLCRSFLVVFNMRAVISRCMAIASILSSVVTVR